MPALARLHRRVRAACLPFIPSLHSPHDDLRYFTGHIAENCETWVAEDGEPSGYIAFREGWIDHLYVDPHAQRQGIGTRLMSRATDDRSPRNLWTFQRNAPANRFYLARGWVAVERTDGQTNEEREPDTRYSWPAQETHELELRTPSPSLLTAFAAALDAGWSPSTTHDTRAATLAEIGADQAAFFRGLTHGEGIITLPDGGRVARLPGRVFWLWDGAFCGAINFRHVPRTAELPPHVSGHIGYSIVGLKQRRGYATKALGAILPHARDVGLERVMVTCDEANHASRKVIEANGGVFAGPVPPCKLAFWIAT